MRHDFRVQLLGLLGVLVLIIGAGQPGLNPLYRHLAPTGHDPAGVTVSDVEIGSEAGADQRVSSPATVFRQETSVVASVGTAGEGAEVELDVRWLDPDGRVIRRSARMISPHGRQRFSFEIDPERPGRYRVDVRIDGRVEASRAFEVRAA